MPAVKVASRRRPRVHRVLAPALVVVWTLVLAPGAGAQGPGVVFEPGSPSYKEYSIPLEQARRDAGGGIPGSIDSLPFGIGLSQRVAGGAGERRRDGARGGTRGGARPRGDGAATGPDGGGVGGRELAERLASAETAGAPFLWRWAPLLLVLLPGLLVGLLLAVRDGGAREQPV